MKSRSRSAGIAAQLADLKIPGGPGSLGRGARRRGRCSGEGPIGIDLVAQHDRDPGLAQCVRETGDVRGVRDEVVAGRAVSRRMSRRRSWVRTGRGAGHRCVSTLML